MHLVEPSSGSATERTFQVEHVLAIIDAEEQPRWVLRRSKTNGLKFQ